MKSLEAFMKKWSSSPAVIRSEKVLAVECALENLILEASKGLREQERKDMAKGLVRFFEHYDWYHPPYVPDRTPTFRSIDCPVNGGF